MTPDEWRMLRRRAKAIHRDEEPGVLAPPEAFSDRRADDGIRNDYLAGHVRTPAVIVRSRAGRRWTRLRGGRRTNVTTREHA